MGRHAKPFDWREFWETYKYAVYYGAVAGLLVVSILFAIVVVSSR